MEKIPKSPKPREMPKCVTPPEAPIAIIPRAEYLALLDVADKAKHLFDKFDLGFVKDSPIDRLKQAIKKLDATGFIK